MTREQIDAVCKFWPVPSAADINFLQDVEDRPDAMTPRESARLGDLAERWTR